MSPQVAARVFEPFYTTKPAGRGTGLGLAQVRQLTRQSNGATRMRTAEAKGTRFELWLNAGLGEKFTPVPASNEARPASSTRILLVDDDPDVRVTVAAFLSAQGFIVETASDGSEAVACCNTTGPMASFWMSRCRA